jgi:hypothetical protein
MLPHQMIGQLPQIFKKNEGFPRVWIRIAAATLASLLSGWFCYSLVVLRCEGAG